MPSDDIPAYEQKVEHSHSRMTKFVDELIALAEAVRSTGTYEAHHRKEFRLFLERLQHDFEQHVEYEEEELFPELRETISEPGDDAIERAIDEHEELARLIDAIERRADELNAGQSSEDTDVQELLRGIEALQRRTEHHDETEEEIFDAVGSED